jgi:ribonuclease P protein component
MLPRQTRMKRPADFRRTVRQGQRAGRPSLTGHLLVPAVLVHDGPVSAADGVVRPAEPAKVGFVVSRAVGTAVIRNRVKRRLRALLVEYLDVLPEGSLFVVRANPAAASARQADLAADLDLVLGRLLRRQVGALHRR